MSEERLVDFTMAKLRKKASVQGNTRQKENLTENRLQVKGKFRLQDPRLTELLDIAADVFIEQGFESTSLNDIARRANASKSTFYSRFPTKEILFSKVIEYRMGEVFNKIEPTLPLDAPISKTLSDFATAILRAALSPTQINLIRMVSMESKRFPKLGQRFYELGAGRGKAALAKFFLEQKRRGILREDDVQIMAEHLISLIIGGPVHWYVLGFRPTMPEAEERVKHVEAAVSAFLRAYSR